MFRIDMARNWPLIVRYYYDNLPPDTLADKSIWEWLEEEFGATRFYTQRKGHVVATALRFRDKSDLTAFILKVGSLQHV